MKRSIDTPHDDESQPNPVFQAIHVNHRSYSNDYTIKDDENNSYILKKLHNSRVDLTRNIGILNMKEVHFMTNVRHPYILTSLKVYFEDPCPNTFKEMLSKDQEYDRVYFLTEKYDYSCKELVDSYRAPISHVKRAMFQIVCALHHLHNQGIIHRDLEPRNFLCYYKGGVLTTRLTKSVHNSFRDSNTGLSYYRAPEELTKSSLEAWNKTVHMTYPREFRNQVKTLLLIRNRKGNLFHDYVDKNVMQIIFSYMSFNAAKGRSCGSPALDIWTLGCSFVELVSGQTLFYARTNSEVLKLIKQKRGPISPKPIRTLLRLDRHKVELFDMPVVDNLANPGLLTDFCDMVDKMLRFNPDSRISINEVLGHPFFAGFFIDNPRHYNLWRPDVVRKGNAVFASKPLSIVQEFPKQHKHWKVGFDTFMRMNGIVNDTEVQYFILFHGLDIYNRYLLEVKPSDDKIMYKKIAWCSAYMACKYFLDETSPCLWGLFPESSLELTTTEIISIEKQILITINFEVYRPTCLTYIRNRSFSATLFALMGCEDIMYGKPIESIMEKFNDTILDIHNHSSK